MPHTNKVSPEIEIVALGNRLNTLICTPGYHDLIRISQQIAEEVNLTFLEFEGWDVEQIAALKSGALVAKKYHSQLFSRVHAAIVEGAVKAAELNAARGEKSLPIDEDELYQRVFQEVDGRIPGTYTKDTQS